MCKALYEQIQGDAEIAAYTGVSRTKNPYTGTECEKIWFDVYDNVRNQMSQQYMQYLMMWDVSHQPLN